MSKDPNDMDDMRPGDRAMLLALSRRQRDITPLSLDQERLLDSWTDGHLPPADADRAAELTKHNTFAAERILERRLIAAASDGPGVPSTLAARVLRGSRKSRGTSGIFNLQWRRLSRWQWSGLGVALAATIVVAVFGFQYWQAQLRPDQRFQIAMVTVEDQSVLSGGPRRTRGISNPPQSTDATRPENGAKSGQSYFRDVDVPTTLLQRAIASASAGKSVVEHIELMNYLRSQSDTFDNRARVLIESTLAGRLAKPDERPVIRVRVYDLDDPRAANIRSKIKPPEADAHLILLTLKQ
jgi:hypothetical protein